MLRTPPNPLAGTMAEESWISLHQGTITGACGIMRRTGPRSASITFNASPTAWLQLAGSVNERHKHPFA